MRSVPPSAKAASANSGVKTTSDALPANGARLSLLIFPNGTDPITIQVRNEADTAWINAAPAVKAGEAYYDDEYDGPVNVTGANLNYTVIEY